MSKPTTPRRESSLPRRRPPPRQPEPSARPKPRSAPGTSAPAASVDGHPSSPTPVRRHPPPAAARDTPEEPAESFEIGYGKPPKNGRFKKGEIANPNGRPKRARVTEDELLVAAVRGELDQSIDITEGSKAKRVRKKQVLAKSLINKAMKGDNPAIKTLIALLGEQEASPAVAPPEEPLTADDLDTLRWLLGDEAVDRRLAAELAIQPKKKGQRDV